MAGKIIADTIESSASQISLNVGNVTVLTASSAGTGLTTANITTANVTGVATFSAGSVGTPSITASGDTNTGLYFPAADTIAFTTAGSEDMRIDASGNIGIGTSSPVSGSRLSVVGGSTQLSGGTTAQAGFRFQHSSSVATITGINNDNNAFNPIAFYTSGSEAMRIDTSGNLHLGSTSPPEAGRLLVSSTSLTAVPIVIQQTAAGATNYNSVIFYRNAASTGSISATATNTAYNTSSDYRLKENVQPMQNALAKIAALKPCTYTWKLNGSLGEGFIAHELAEVVPQAVNGEKNAVDSDGKIIPQGIDTSYLVATLTAAIQELKVIVDAQAVEIAALKAK